MTNDVVLLCLVSAVYVAIFISLWNQRYIKGKIDGIKEAEIFFRQLNSITDSNVETEEEKEQVLSSMEQYGGSFVKSLAQCFRRADPNNFRLLRNTFDKYWREYKK